MNLDEQFGIDNRIEFNLFKAIYEHHLKDQTNCELAFQQSLRYFLNIYGYEPYENLDEYLKELFDHLNGFQLFENHL